MGDGGNWMAARRRQWTAEQKLGILQEGRQAGASVAEVCRRHGITPGTFYAWEERARQGALERLRRVQPARKPRHEGQLEATVARRLSRWAPSSASTATCRTATWLRFWAYCAAWSWIG